MTTLLTEVSDSLVTENTPSRSTGDKIVYTLNINGYSPRIRELTYPTIRGWAAKIEARFIEITERRFPDWPVTYEKLQIHERARRDGAQWAIYVDADTLINPDFFDVTEHLSRDTVAHNASDMAGIRWKYDDYFRRDGRHIGSGNWFAVASDWCLDLWHPLDIALDEALQNVNVTVAERNFGIKREHLIDDYALSRNIARYGLKFKTVTEICLKLGVGGMMWHNYLATEDDKARMMLNILATKQGVELKLPHSERDTYGIGWGVMTEARAEKFADAWGMPVAWRQWRQ